MINTEQKHTQTTWQTTRWAEQKRFYPPSLCTETLPPFQVIHMFPTETAWSLGVMLAHMRWLWRPEECFGFILAAIISQFCSVCKLKKLHGVWWRCTWCISTWVFDSSLIMSPKNSSLSSFLITVSIFPRFLPLCKHSDIPTWCIDTCTFICSCPGFMEGINSWRVKTSKKY